MSIRKIERSIDLPDRQRIVWHNPGSFTKNPDVIRFDDGRMLFVYNDSNQHFPTEYSRITLVESIDGGETWGNPLMLDESFPIKGEERWVTPRISLLSDGRERCYATPMIFITVMKISQWELGYGGVVMKAELGLIKN